MIETIVSWIVFSGTITGATIGATSGGMVLTEMVYVIIDALSYD